MNGSKSLMAAAIAAVATLVFPGAALAHPFVEHEAGLIGTVAVPDHLLALAALVLLTRRVLRLGGVRPALRSPELWAMAAVILLVIVL